MLLLLGAISLGLMQSSTPPAAAPQAPPSTPVYGPSHIKVKTLHLAFDLPEGIRSREDIADQMNQKFQKKSPTGEKCVSVPALAFDPVALRRIYFYHYRGDCFPSGITQESLRNVVSPALKGILQASGMPSMTSPLDYELASHPATVVSGNVFSEANHGLLFGEMACASMEGDIACWAFISSTAPKTMRLATLPVQFDGKDPVPVIPEDLSRFVALPSITFRDEQRHLDFTYSGSFANSQPRANDVLKKKAEEADDSQKKALGCMKLLLNADDLEDNERSNIFLYALPFECSKLSPGPSALHDFAVGLTKGLAKAAKSEVGKPTMYKLAGQDAIVIRDTLHPPNGKDLALFETCTVAGPEILCWQITSTSIDRLAPLAASTVSFNGHPAVPIVPPDVLQKIEAEVK